MGFGAGLASLAATGGQVMAGYKQALHQDNVNNYIDQTHDYDLNQQAAKNSLLPIETQNKMLGAQLQGLNTQTQIDLQPITDQTQMNTANTDLLASQGSLAAQPFKNQATLGTAQTQATNAGTGLVQAKDSATMQRQKDIGQTYHLMNTGDLSGAIDYANNAGLFSNQKVANIQAAMLPLKGPDGKAVPTKVYRFLGADGNPVTDAKGMPAVYTDQTLRGLSFMANPPSIITAKKGDQVIGFSPSTGPFNIANNPVGTYSVDRYGQTVLNTATGQTMPVSGGSVNYSSPAYQTRSNAAKTLLQQNYSGSFKGSMWVPDPSNTDEYDRASLYAEKLLQTNPTMSGYQAAVRARAMAHQDMVSGKISGAGVGPMIGGNQRFGLGDPYPAPGQTAPTQSPTQNYGLGNPPSNGQPKYPWQPY